MHFSFSATLPQVTQEFEFDAAQAFSGAGLNNLFTTKATFGIITCDKSKHPMKRAGPRAAPHCPSLIADGVELVSVGVADVSGIECRAIMRAQAGLAFIAAALGEGRRMEAVDGLAIVCKE